MLGTRLRILHLLAASIGLILLAFAASNPAAAQFCTQQFDPVCARSKPVGVAKTFSNACFAKAAGAVTFAEHTTCENLICPLVFFPVCGVKNGACTTWWQCDPIATALSCSRQVPARRSVQRVVRVARWTRGESE